MKYKKTYNSKLLKILILVTLSISKPGRNQPAEEIPLKPNQTRQVLFPNDVIQSLYIDLKNTTIDDNYIKVGFGKGFNWLTCSINQNQLPI